MIHLKSDSIRNVPISYVLLPPMNSACNSNCNLHLLLVFGRGSFPRCVIAYGETVFFFPEGPFFEMSIGQQKCNHSDRSAALNSGFR